MTYTHLTTDELVIIESYFKMNQSVAKTAHCLNRSRQTIHKVYLFFKQGKSALEYYQQPVVLVNFFLRGKCLNMLVNQQKNAYSSLKTPKK
ncbi:hypothetical protein EfmAA94_19830 [Enterococcus faecium]|nr:hypothetical protein EfmAA94_19830 [Enterococcus faecium]